MYTESVPQSILSFIRNHTHFLILSHIEPDGDCIGSSLGLHRFLTRIGKSSRMYNPGPFRRTEISGYERDFSAQPEAIQPPESAVIVLDCSGEDRLGDMLGPVRDLPLAVIDHHLSSDDFGDERFVMSDAPSTSVLVQAVIEAWGEGLTRDEAEPLLFGLCTDTGFFRFLEEGSQPAFAAAARLTAAGASPRRADEAINAGKPLAARLFLGEMLRRTTSHYGGRLLVSWTQPEDVARFGEGNKDSDTLYRLLLASDGCVAVALLKQEDEDYCTGSLRSRDEVNVSELAERFGGGGHFHAAGFRCEAQLDSLIHDVVEAFADALGHQD